jgi:hypothetical protein
MAEQDNKPNGDGQGQQAAAAPAEDKFIWVASGRTDDRVALTEKDERHPNGEAFVATKTPTKVWHTDKIEAALRAGVIVKTDEPVAVPVVTETEPTAPKKTGK